MPGGILSYGIPEFRLKRETIKGTIERIENLGVDIKTHTEIGKDISLAKIKEKYDAVFFSIGSNISAKMQIEGENSPNVFGANELLQKSNHPDYTNKKVIIIGGGNVAMDTARTIKRLGAKNVTIVYRRAEEQMTAGKKEIQTAKKEGIEFLFQTKIIKILEEKKVECIKTELVQKEGTKRPYPIDIKGSNYILDTDYVIMAIGSCLDKKLVSELGLEINEKNYIKIDENYMTNIPGIFAGGDAIGEIATVAWASKSGRNAGIKMEEWLKENI